MGRIVASVVEGRPRVCIREHDQETDLPALWLRQHSQEATECDSITGQRLFDPHLLPIDLHLVAVESVGERLVVTFSDGHTSSYDHEALLANATLSDGVPLPRHWRATSGPPRVHRWADVDDPASERAALEDFLVYGVVVFEGVPTSPGALLGVATQFGFVRDTNFGPVFDVRSIPDSTDLAYRAVPLSAHTDNPYRTPVPGIQLLHCLVNETAGGLSTLVDGLAVVDQLRVVDPEAVEVLAAVPVRFRYRDAGTDIVTIRPVIDRDRFDTVVGLNYSPRLDDMPLLSTEETLRYQSARQQLAHLLASPEFEVRFPLKAGQLMMFDNNRVLHGRTEFDPNEGLRHLQGCYIDQDGPRARFRVLTRQRTTEIPASAEASEDV
ncbi:MAG: TauD/TfdA family dioxygenase [Actinomycetes bacterium]